MDINFLSCAVKNLKKSEWPYIFIVTFTALFTRLKYFFYLYCNITPDNGFPRAYDTNWYIEHANAFINSFKIDMTIDGIFYFSYYSLLSLLIKLFKSEITIVLFQMVLSALSVILVYNIALLLFNRGTAFFAGILYAFTWPVITWSAFIITDSFFITLLLLNVFFLLKVFENKNKYYKYLFVISSIYLLFFRPTGIVSLAFIFIYIFAHMNGNKRIFVSALIFVTMTSFMAFQYIESLKPLVESFNINLKWLLEENYSNGQIFDVPTRYDYIFNAVKEVKYFNSFAFSFFINNWFHILVLYIRRAVFFWAFSLENFSITKIYYIIVYAFGFFGMASIYRNKIIKRTSILFLIIFSIMFFCILFFMDSAFRYRAPALVFANIIAAYGLERFVSAVYFKGVLKNKIFNFNK